LTADAAAKIDGKSLLESHFGRDSSATGAEGPSMIVLASFRRLAVLDGFENVGNVAQRATGCQIARLWAREYSLKPMPIATSLISQPAELEFEFQHRL
jgi:hypothetical protein